MRLNVADLYYIPNFQFDNGNNRDKYLIVLTDSVNDRLLLTLPTSIGRVPDHLENNQAGCISCDKSQFNCYRFLQGEVVTDGAPQFFFPLDTHLYGEWIGDWSANALQMDYSVNGVDYEFMGQIKKEIFKAILVCFLESSKVKRKFKPRLQKILDSLSNH